MGGILFFKFASSEPLNLYSQDPVLFNDHDTDYVSISRATDLRKYLPNVVNIETLIFKKKSIDPCDFSICFWYIYR